ncbi:MAG: 4-oxalocrotonate tautomerase [Deltaproteobacteria bacterium]|nr:4-oxalocrotonate tautomerase [Deltaproteobacteria bacterium]
MPHVIVKMYKGRLDDVKMQLAKEIVKDVSTIAECEEKVVSVAFEEYGPAEWPEKVYKPDIISKADTLAIKPGYNPFQAD